MSETYTLRILWGHITHDGRWGPNPHLMMSEAEQLRQNLKSGAMPGHVALTPRQAALLMEIPREDVA